MTDKTQAFHQAFHQIDEALQTLRKGGGVIVMDDEARENEGDLIFPAETITTEQMAMLIRDCSGIVCLCLPPEKTRALDLPMMVENNTNRGGTGFTVSIEATHGVTTGVSATDRVTTIKAAIADGARPEDLRRPGHIFPLRARAGGVLEREGHTEATIDLMRLAGLKPAGVLCELMNPDGSMARRAECDDYSKRHGFPILTIEALVAYRKHQESKVSPTISSTVSSTPRAASGRAG